MDQPIPPKPATGIHKPKPNHPHSHNRTNKKPPTSYQLYNRCNSIRHNPLNDTKQCLRTLPCTHCYAANSRIGIARLERLSAGIKDLPVTLLDLDIQITESLQKSGIHKVGGLLNISPASLTRRFGPACVKYLDCLLGKHPYPVNPVRSSEFFERSLDLPIEVDDTNALQFATQRMANELSAFLITRDCGVNGYSFTLRHERQQDTSLQLRFLQATSQPKHLHQVLSERLSQTALTAPVCGLHILSDSFSPIERDASDFFQKSQRQQSSLGEVVDKLCGRLGQDALHTLLTVEDHRPEKAWKKSFPDCAEDYNPHWPQRPVWMLEKNRNRLVGRYRCPSRLLYR